LFRNDTEAKGLYLVGSVLETGGNKKSDECGLCSHRPETLKSSDTERCWVNEVATGSGAFSVKTCGIRGVKPSGLAATKHADSSNFE
jgi:hypothetical protein